MSLGWKSDMRCPGPQQYDSIQTTGGKGYSNLHRAPAYTFGHRTPISSEKQLLTPKAPVLNIFDQNQKGPHTISHDVVSPRLEPPQDRGSTPDKYDPGCDVVFKKPPAYSMRPAGNPSHEPWDMWTPPPNVYCPAMSHKKAPAYTFGCVTRDSIVQTLPGPAEHDPNFEFVMQRIPSYSFGAPFKMLKPKTTPPPNAYCEKKNNFMSDSEDMSE